MLTKGSVPRTLYADDDIMTIVAMQRENRGYSLPLYFVNKIVP